MKKANGMFFLSLIIFFSGCATWTVLNGGEYRFNDVGFKASLPNDWMAYKPAYGFMMTKDGFSLNHISVKKIKFLQRLANTNKRFQKGMLLQEILEVEIDSIRSNKRIYYLNIIKNEPVTIDGLEAYRIEYEYEEKSGLKVKAIQSGFIYNGFVYRIVFKAARIHYYDATRKDFETFLESFKLL